MRIALVFLTLVAAVGCGTSVTPADAGIDAPREIEIDAAPPPDAGPPDGGCDVSPTPDALPMIAGGFAVNEADGGSTIPIATGGDPIGTWVFDTATFYVGPAAASMFDLESSMVEGTAWVAVDATEARLDFRFTTTLMGTLAGTIVRPSSTQVHATYTLAGPEVMFAPICLQSSAMMAPTDGGAATTSMQRFSVEGDRMTWFSRVSGASGTIDIVLEGSRRP